MSSKLEKQLTEFSEFIRTATKEEKQEVYDLVIQRSILAQNRAIAEFKERVEKKLAQTVKG